MNHFNFILHPKKIPESGYAIHSYFWADRKLDRIIKETEGDSSAKNSFSISEASRQGIGAFFGAFFEHKGLGEVPLRIFIRKNLYKPETSLQNWIAPFIQSTKSISELGQYVKEIGKEIRLGIPGSFYFLTIENIISVCRFGGINTKIVLESILGKEPYFGDDEDNFDDIKLFYESLIIDCDERFLLFGKGANSANDGYKRWNYETSEMSLDTAGKKIKGGKLAKPPLWEDLFWKKLGEYFKCYTFQKTRVDNSDDDLDRFQKDQSVLGSWINNHSKIKSNINTYFRSALGEYAKTCGYFIPEFEQFIKGTGTMFLLTELPGKVKPIPTKQKRFTIPLTIQNIINS